MKIIQPFVELYPQEDYTLEGIYKQVEKCARCCYSEDTEVLTNNGWKLFPDVLDNDLVLSYNPKVNELIWDKPNIIHKEIEDSMLEITHANIKICVTKNHRIYQSVPEKREYSFLTAAQLLGSEKIPHSRQNKFRIPKYFVGSKRNKNFIRIPHIHWEKTINGGNHKDFIKSIDFDCTKDFMIIAGAYISEGCTMHGEKHKSGSYCQITQTENTELYNNTIQALQNLNWKYNIFWDKKRPSIKHIRFNYGQAWVELFEDLFGRYSNNKHLPVWFRELPDEYLEVLVKNLYLGDGSHSNTRKERYLSISQRLLSEIQEVFILLGKNAAYTFDKEINQKCSLEESTRDSWIIRRDKHIKELPIRKQTVWCTCTNSGIICIRYKGKTCWCGNSYKSEDKITETSSKAFVNNLIKAGHYAPLEFGTIYLTITLPKKAWNKTVVDKYYRNPYSKCNNTYDDLDYIYCITTNYRVLVENKWLDDLNYLCAPTEYHQKRYCVKFTTDIGVAREFTRHKIFCVA